MSSRLVFGVVEPTAFTASGAVGAEWRTVMLMNSTPSLTDLLARDLRRLADRAARAAANVPPEAMTVTAHSKEGPHLPSRASSKLGLGDSSPAGTPELLGLLRTSREEALGYEKEFWKATEGVLLKAGREAADAFEQRATDFLTADASEGPGWSPPSVDEVFASDTLMGLLATKMNPLRRRVVETLATEPLNALGVSFDITSPFFAAALDTTGAAVKEIGDTTRREVQAIMARALKEGLSIPTTADFIRVSMRDLSRARARVIALTETSRLVNGGALATMRIVSNATGERYRKRWLTAAGAEHPRHYDYEGLGGQTVALNDPFNVGGYPADHPGDPSLPPEESIGCRCTVVFEKASS